MTKMIFDSSSRQCCFMAVVSFNGSRADNGRATGQIETQAKRDTAIKRVATISIGRSMSKMDDGV